MDLLQVEKLSKRFSLRNGRILTALDEVSFSVGKGETLALVGESGCGKSTAARCLMRLEVPTSGRILFRGQEITEKGVTDLRRHMQIVFQNPVASLDARQSVESILSEPLEIHHIGDRASRRERAVELLEQVGLEARDIGRYPHSFSGGQLQRIAIARALALKPELIICDEAVSALDVSIQAQIMRLLLDLQRTLGLAYLFITHNLAIVPHVATRVAVMYLGRIVEIGDTRAIFDDPQHPYTQALLSSVLSADPSVERGRRTIELSGEVPNPVKVPSGCRFHPRCFRAELRCSQTEPVLEKLRGERWAACFYPGTTRSDMEATNRTPTSRPGLLGGPASDPELPKTG